MESDYWKREFLKVVDYWYNNEKPNMDKVEFIATKERKEKPDKEICNECGYEMPGHKNWCGKYGN